MARGFILFELILVLVLLAICSTIGFISYTGIKGTSFAHDIALFNLVLRTAATRASCLKKEQIITLDEGVGACALLYDGVRYPLQPGFSFGVIPGTYGPPSAPEKLITQPITFVDKKISAYADGTLQSGTLYITDSHDQYALTTPVFGFSYIRVYRYHHRQWHLY